MFPTKPARRSRVRTGIALGLAAAATAAAATACGGGSAGLGSPDQSNVRVGVVESLGAVPFNIGISQGSHAFVDAGLTIAVQNYTSAAEELSALASGKIDIAFGQYAEFLDSQSQLAATDNLRVVSEGYDAGAGTIGLMTRSGYSLPAWGPNNPFNCDGSDTIVVPNAKSTEYLALASWFQSLGSPLPTNCPAIHVQADPTKAIAAVAGGQSIGAVLQEPYVTAGQVSAALQETQDLATGNAAAVPVDGYFATKSFVDKYPHTTQIFAAVMAKLQASSGQRVVIEHALLASGQTDKRVISAMQLGTYPTVVLPAKLDIVLRLMNNAGTVSGMLDSAKLTDLTPTT